MRWPRATRSRVVSSVLIAVAFLIGISACDVGEVEVRNPQIEYREMPGGDPEAGEIALFDYGCGACHTIPGIVGADATVGPPLTDWSERMYIAGSLLNTPENLLIWIMDPQAIEPGTAMPDLGVTEEDARDIGAYLYLLGDND